MTLKNVLLNKVDIKFKNSYYGANKMLYEYSWKVLSSRLIIMDLIYMIISAVSWYFSYINGLTTSIAIWEFVLIVELGIVVIILSLTARQLKIHNNKEYESIVKFSDEIYMREVTFSLDIEYSQIINIYYLKHSCAFMFAKNAVIIATNKFSKDDINCF